MRKVVVSLFIFILFIPLMSQITIEYPDIPMTVGLSWQTYKGELMTVDVGNLGGPQTWNFTNLVTSDLEYRSLIIPSSAPHFDSFPTANYVEFTERYFSSDSHWTYCEVIPSYFKFLGESQYSHGHNFTFGTGIQIDFPWSYLDSLDFNILDTIFDSGPIVTTCEYIIRSINDAWGTLVIPNGSYQALRIRGMHCFITTSYFNSVVTDSDTTNSIIYQWYAKNIPRLLIIKSCDNDTNLYFTDASETYMFANYTSVSENPSNGSVSNCNINRDHYGYYILSYDGLENSSLEVLDVTGRRIMSGQLSGTGFVRINPDLHGIFFVKVRGPNTDFSKKISYF